MIDIVIVALIGTAMAGVIWKKVKDHKEGKSGCGCGCGGGCSSCSSWTAVESILVGFPSLEFALVLNIKKATGALSKFGLLTHIPK